MCLLKAETGESEVRWKVRCKKQWHGDKENHEGAKERRDMSSLLNDSEPEDIMREGREIDITPSLTGSCIQGSL